MASKRHSTVRRQRTYRNDLYVRSLLLVFIGRSGVATNYV